MTGHDAALGDVSVRQKTGVESEAATLGPLGAPTLEPASSIMGSINPLARIIGMAIIGTTLLVTVDWVSGAVAILCEFVLLMATGITFQRIMKYTWYLFVLAPISGVSVVLYSHPGGRIYWEWGMIHISDNSIGLGIALSIRMLAVALPALALFIDTDPVRASDALAQNGHLPSRIVLAALTSVRMTDRLVRDWKTIEQARRARGLADSGWTRRMQQMTFTLLVMALRRASDLSTAMEARGFGGDTERTWARPSAWQLRDTVAVMVAAGVAVIAIGSAVWAGTFRWFGL